MSDPTVVKLVGVMASFPVLFTPKHISNGEELKFSIRYILPPTFDKTSISAAINAAAAQKNLTGKFKNTVGKVEEGHKMAGSFVLNTTNYVESPSKLLEGREPPIVAPEDVYQPILDPNAVFGGCIVDVVVKFSGYTTGSSGVRCESKIIVLRRNDMAPLVEGGQLNVEDYFTAVDNAPMQTANSTADVQQQQQQQQPAQDAFNTQPQGGGVDPGAPANAPVDDPWNQ